MYKYKNMRPEYDLLCRGYSFIQVQYAGPACSKPESMYVYLIEFTWQKGSFLNIFWLYVNSNMSFRYNVMPQVTNVKYINFYICMPASKCAK